MHRIFSLYQYCFLLSLFFRENWKTFTFLPMLSLLALELAARSTLCMPGIHTNRHTHRHHRVWYYFVRNQFRWTERRCGLLWLRKWNWLKDTIPSSSSSSSSYIRICFPSKACRFFFKVGGSCFVLYETVPISLIYTRKWQNLIIM